MSGLFYFGHRLKHAFTKRDTSVQTGSERSVALTVASAVRGSVAVNPRLA
jgi:hypothetical protein